MQTFIIFFKEIHKTNTESFTNTVFLSYGESTLTANIECKRGSRKQQATY